MPVDSVFFGVTLTVLAYWLGRKAEQKTGLVICNAMIVAVVLVIAVLKVFHISYDDYYVGGEVINLFLAPATACLGVSIYAKRDLLRRYWLPVLAGCAAGVAASAASVLILSRLFGLDRAMVLSLLPKSVTLPIAPSIAEGDGGIVAVTVAAVTITGILGNVMAPAMIRVFRVKDPVAVGLGIGACSHALGTARAMEIGETEGAVSGLAMGLCGILTAGAALFFGYLV